MPFQFSILLYHLNNIIISLPGNYDIIQLVLAGFFLMKTELKFKKYYVYCLRLID